MFNAKQKKNCSSHMLELQLLFYTFDKTAIEEDCFSPCLVITPFTFIFLAYQV